MGGKVSVEPEVVSNVNITAEMCFIKMSRLQRIKESGITIRVC